MTLYGFIFRKGDENLSFVLAVFKENDDFYIQSTYEGSDIVNEFIKINVNEKDIIKSKDLKSFEKHKEKPMTYIFIDHNGHPLIAEKNKAEELNEYYKQVFFSMFEVMNFLGKENEMKKIMKILFPEYVNNEVMQQKLAISKIKNNSNKIQA